MNDLRLHGVGIGEGFRCSWQKGVMYKAPAGEVREFEDEINMKLPHFTGLVGNFGKFFGNVTVG